jgi:hypothetical protein
VEIAWMVAHPVQLFLRMDLDPISAVDLARVIGGENEPSPPPRARPWYCNGTGAGAALGFGGGLLLKSLCPSDQQQGQPSQTDPVARNPNG